MQNILSLLMIFGILNLNCATFSLASQENSNRRIFWASQFTLIPESEALREFGKSLDPKEALNPSSIKILVWNIKKGQEPGLDQDLTKYGIDKDLLIVSEGYLSPKVKSIFESIPVRWDMGVSFLYKKDHNYETGTLIGSNVQPKSIEVKHTKDLEPFILTPKALTIGSYPIQGRADSLLVISMHAINVVLPSAFQRHLELAKPYIQNHIGPVIFAGDFNTNLTTKYQILMDFIQAQGLQNVSFRNDERKKVGGIPIDFIFTRGIQTLDAEVLGKLTSSDHKAMLAELAISP